MGLAPPSIASSAASQARRGDLGHERADPIGIMEEWSNGMMGSKKILGIIGSPRKLGNCEIMVKEISKQISIPYELKRKINQYLKLKKATTNFFSAGKMP
jgi:hypothetical protein